jgi:CheY-like chemotaxis protein
VVDINVSVQRMMSMLSRLVGERIEISLFLEPAIQATRLDPTQLEQVILNLVVNARDAMPNGGQLTLSSSNEVLDAVTASQIGVPVGPYVLLGVTDTGVGMDEQTRARIFEPFFTTKEVGGGLGLGLSTAQGIVEQSGGAIRVESALGAGARFFVYLPAVGKRVPAPERNTVTSIRTGSETIAVAEDESAVRSVMCEVLSNAGYRVLAAGTSSEVLRALQAFDGTLHLLMSDLVMPGMTGIELAHAVRACQPNVRVLIVSGYSKYKQLPSAMHFLPKPFTEAELLGKVREVLDAPVPLHVDG